MDTWINLKEASEILGLSTNTVKKLVDEGYLLAYEITGVQGLRFRREDVQKLIKPVEPSKKKPVSSNRKRTS